MQGKLLGVVKGKFKAAGTTENILIMDFVNIFQKTTKILILEIPFLLFNLAVETLTLHT